MKELKPRYTIGTVSTNDEEFAKTALTFYATHKFTHEEIYKIGIETLIKNSSTRNTIEN